MALTARVSGALRRARGTSSIWSGVLVALGLCSGCGRPPPPSQFPTADAALARMHATYSCSRGVRGDAKLDLFNKQGRVRGNVLYLAMLPKIAFHSDRMRAAAARAFSNATDLADYLVRKGLPFREAHHVVGRLVATALDRDTTLEDLDLAALRSESEHIDDDVYGVLALEAVVDARHSYGGTARSEVARQIAEARVALAEETTS